MNYSIKLIKSYVSYLIKPNKYEIPIQFWGYKQDDRTISPFYYVVNLFDRISGENIHLSYSRTHISIFSWKFQNSLGEMSRIEPQLTDTRAVDIFLTKRWNADHSEKRGCPRSLASNDLLLRERKPVLMQPDKGLVKVGRVLRILRVTSLGCPPNKLVSESGAWLLSGRVSILPVQFDK